jgi:hypothetical protein
VNRPAINMGMQGFFLYIYLQSFEYMPKSVRAGKNSSLMKKAFSDFFFFFFAVLGLELRACTLSSHSTALFCDGFFQDRVSRNYLPRLASN